MQSGCGNAYASIYPESIRLIGAHTDRLFKKGGCLWGVKRVSLKMRCEFGGSRGWLSGSLIMCAKVLLTHMLSTVLDDFAC